jgi:hypothetical protein
VQTTFVTGMFVALAEEIVVTARGRDPDASRQAKVHTVLLGV